MTVAGDRSADTTVIIPARNAAVTIGATLRSIAPARDLILEVLLIDDGSDDRTAVVATEIAARHGLSLEVVSGRFGGAGAARNAGMARASGKYLFLLDADDELVAGGLALLRDALERNPQAGLAIGASIRRTGGRPDKLKVPHGYASDRALNTQRYLRNELWPIAMGSALVAAGATAGIRFPEAIGLDEDTCYWAALLAQADVAAIAAPVLLYHHDEARMARRFITAPRRTFLAIALALDRLAAHGVARDVLQWRKGWVAQRIARQLIKHGRFAEAAGMMRAVRAHKTLGRSRKSLQYQARIRFGRLVRPRAVPASAPAGTREHRTLVVCYDPAFPPTSGADLRNFGHAAAAAEFGPVCLVSIRPLGEPLQLPAANIRLAALTTDQDAGAASLGWWRRSGEARIPRPALARLEALTRDFRPDTVVVEGIALFKLLGPLRALAGQLILDMHNVESDLAGQLRGAHGARSNTSGVRRLESKAAAIADRIWVCSRLDRERLEAHVSREVAIDVVPNGIPRSGDLPSALPAQPNASAGFPLILFIGHLGYQPNIDAAERLARNILPRIRRVLPSARLILAGRSPKPPVRALAGLDDVALVEDPDDVRPLLSQAHLSIIPLATGGGTRIKILEAMAFGVPVLATPLASEGLDLTNQELLLSDSDEELAEMAIALCTDQARMAGLRVRAYDAAWSRYGPQAIRNAVHRGLGVDGEPAASTIETSDRRAAR